jgi:hypothetical protein
MSNYVNTDLSMLNPDTQSNYNKEYNKALDAVLSAIDDEVRMQIWVNSKGFKLLYKETLINVVKSLKKTV